MSASARTWVYNPHRGGKTVPEPVRRRIEARLRRVAERDYAGRYRELDVRFRGKFCYVDVFTEPIVPEDWPPSGGDESREEFLERVRATPLHLCRLRYHHDDRWSFAFFSYASERYEPSCFGSGDLQGTPEEAFELAASLRLT
jgi:hypothetical protein